MATGRPPTAASARHRRYQLWTRAEETPQSGHARTPSWVRAWTRTTPSSTHTCSTSTFSRCGNTMSSKSSHAADHATKVTLGHPFTEILTEPLDDAAHLPHLGPTWAHSCDPGERTFPAPFLHRRPDLLRTRRTISADLQTQTDVDHKRGGRRSFTWTDYRDLLIAAHRQLGAPLVLVWDNLNVHLDARLRAFIAAQDWVVSFQLPPYAPDLNPVEGIWSLARRAGQNNIAFTDPEHLMRVLRRTLREIQYRSDVIDGCLAATGHPDDTQPESSVYALWLYLRPWQVCWRCAGAHPSTPQAPCYARRP